jgi:proline iminopeptidase
MSRNAANRDALTPVLGLALALCATAACLDPDAPGKLVPGTVEDDPSLPRIEVAGTTLHAEAFGDPSAPMIMVLHGGPGADYRSLLPYRALADDGYYVVFWDQRGAGLSKRYDASSYTLDLYLEDLRQVIEHFSSSSGQPIVFLGHSWGAMYATWFVNEHGDYGGRVAGAVLSEPGAFTSDGLEDYLARLFPPFDLTSEELNDVTWLDQFMSPSDHARADFMHATAGLLGIPEQHDDPKNRAPFWRLGAVVNSRLMELSLDEGFDWTTHLGEFPRKVLFLRGELNENMPLAHQQELASHYASSEVITVPGAGHEAIWEQQDEFLSHIRAYLTEIGVAPTLRLGGAR